MTLPVLAHRGAAEHLADALAVAAETPDAIAVIAVPAPRAPAEALLAAGVADRAMLWDPPGDDAIAGVGAAALITGRGRRRIAEVEAEAAALWPRVRVAAHPDLDADGAVPPVRLYGGFAFTEGAADRAPWSDFGDARFTLPRWTYRGGRAPALALALTGAEARDTGRWLGEHERIAGALAAPLPPMRSPAVTSIREMDRDAWREQIEAIRGAIAARRCEKIVAARAAVVDLDAPADPIAVLRALGDRHRDCHRFAHIHGDAAFVGATPERLVSRRGDRVESEALAGSIARGDGADDAAAALLASGKDRGEQALVARAIAAALKPLCRELDVPAEPEIRALRDVLHLRTPITGRLRAAVHVLDLVAALHPTPAVGGVPTSAALAWIAEHERDPRGWYAAPVGWFDAGGEGELVVALRSGLLHGASAHLYAGSGIVAGSDPDAEYDETRLKQRALLGALGAQERGM